MLDDGILVSSAFPDGEGAPKGRIGHKRYEREREMRLKSTIYESTRAPLTRSPFPDGEGLGGATLRVNFL